MKGGLRILVILAVASALFLLGCFMLAALVGILIYEKVDVANNPVVAWLANPISGFGEKATTGAAENAGGLLTDNGDYQTENNWVAANTTREIAEFSWLAVAPHAPLPRIEVKAAVDPEKGQVHLELNGWADKPVAADVTAVHAWDPKGYGQLAQQLMGGQKASEPAPSTTSDLPGDLLVPTGQVLATKDVEISRALEQNPSSATLHEDAALLLLTVALRENAYELSDIRLELNRACAHLAIARALNGGADPGTWTGRIAHAALTTLAGRETEALGQLTALGAQPGAPPSVQTWIQLLTLFNKHDWRAVTPDKSSPLLLKIVWAQVLADDLGDTLALACLAPWGDLEQIPDWGRALLGSSSYPSVEIGHQFCSSTIGLEFRELGTILGIEGAPAPSQTPLREIFKRPVGGSVTVDSSETNRVHVVGVDLFEDIAERHLISAVAAAHFWMRDAWGVPDEDTKFCQQMRSLFQGTRREPYLAMFLDRQDADSNLEPHNLKADVTEIPPALAMHIHWNETDRERLIPYFGWGIPFGAPVDMKNRPLVVLNAILSHHHPVRHAPTFRDLMPLAPASYDLASWPLLLNEDRHQPNTLEDERALLSRFLDYNDNALGFFKREAMKQPGFNDALLEEILRKQAALDPDSYYDLGDFLHAHGRDDDAADAYRKGAAQGHDQVLFANKVRFLVVYDFNHNQQDEAMTLAKRAADVYSAAGLTTYAWLLCKLNRGPEALEVEKQIQDRYGGNPLPEFYAAHASLYPDQFAAAVKELYPNGMPTVSLADFTSPPTDGCVFQTSSDNLTRANLRAGDVVVALDSHPVHDETTYAFARAMSDAPEMDLIIWRNDRYLEVKASPPERRFGNSIGNYSAPK